MEANVTFVCNSLHLRDVVSALRGLFSMKSFGASTAPLSVDVVSLSQANHERSRSICLNDLNNVCSNTYLDHYPPLDLSPLEGNGHGGSPTMRFIDSPAKLTRYLVVATIVLLASYAMAGTITPFTGSDDGASTTGPWPLSSAAQTAFLGAAGPTTTSNFQSLPTGVYTPFTLAPGVTVSFNAPNFGDGFTGISDFTFGNLDGFCVSSPNCTQWFGSPSGTATYSFAKPITAFGLWLTGVQTVFTTSFTLTFNDGAAETLNLPINVNGGTTFYGFTDTATFSSITITNLSNDAWGQDVVSYSTQSSTPEPSSLLLLGSGALGLAGMIRRKMML